MSNVEVLNDLQRSYESRGFVVLGCPCGNFAGQEPLTNAELDAWRADLSICFPLFDKVDVKGSQAHPLFVAVQEQLGKARWNYTKFLCDRAGTPVRRFDPICPLAVLKESIEALL